MEETSGQPSHTEVKKDRSKIVEIYDGLLSEDLIAADTSTSFRRNNDGSIRGTGKLGHELIQSLRDENMDTKDALPQLYVLARLSQEMTSRTGPENNDFQNYNFPENRAMASVLAAEDLDPINPNLLVDVRLKSAELISQLHETHAKEIRSSLTEQDREEGIQSHLTTLTEANDQADRRIKRSESELQNMAQDLYNRDISRKINLKVAQDIEDRLNEARQDPSGFVSRLISPPPSK